MRAKCMVLLERIELSTSPLPMNRTTPNPLELQRVAMWITQQRCTQSKGFLGNWPRFGAGGAAAVTPTVSRLVALPVRRWRDWAFPSGWFGVPGFCRIAVARLENSNV